METEQKETTEEQKKEQTDNFLKELSTLGVIGDQTKPNKKRTKGLRGKKKLMALALISTLGSVTKATKKVGITRWTHYEWLKTDERYKKAVEDAEEIFKDTIEDVAKQVALIDKNPMILKQLMSTKLRDRGYGDQLSLEHSGRITNKIDKIEVEIIKRENEIKDTNNKEL
jgi:hypothetical protein